MIFMLCALQQLVIFRWFFPRPLRTRVDHSVEILNEFRVEMEIENLETSPRSVGSLENSNFASWIIFSSFRDLNRLFQFHKRLNFATLFFSMKSLHSVCLVIVAEIHFRSDWVGYSMGCPVSRHINTTHHNTTGNVQVKRESIGVKKCWKNVKCSLVTKYETSVSRCRLTSLT